KPGKVPKHPLTGRNASSTNPKTWGTFEEAVRGMEAHGFAGIGFVFTNSGYTGIDFDHCRDPETGVIDPDVLRQVHELASYTEVSVTGTGLHVIVQGKLPGKGRKVGNREIYDTGRFFALTGVRVPGTPDEIAERPTQIAEFYASLNESKTAPPRGSNATANEDSDEKIVARLKQGGKNAKFAALYDGDTSAYASASEADLALCNRIAFLVGDDQVRIDRIFRGSGLYREKWDSARGDSTYGRDTIRTAIESVLTGTPGKNGAETDWHEARALTDTGNAERLVRRFGKDMRFVHTWNKWITWRGTRWSVENDGTPMAYSKKVARSIYAEASKGRTVEERERIAKWAKTSEKVERRKAMVELAKCEPGIALSHEALDRHEYILNCPNGQIDLRTGELQPHDKTSYITKLCPTRFVADARSPVWDAFIERVLPDEETRSYTQRFFGSALTDNVGDQAMMFACGGGQNGKSTLVNAILDTAGPGYAIKISTEMLLAKQHRNHPTELADLFKVRLAIGMETPKGRALDEPLVKELTGSDRIRARRMREDFWEFPPTHKLVVVTNHMPKVASGEFAVLRRIHQVDFGVRIPESEKDPNLPAKLFCAREAILAWLVAGCREWMTTGLRPPDEVRIQAGDAPDAPTPIDQFLEESTLRTRGARVGATELYAAFASFAALYSYPSVLQPEFGKALGDRGYGRKKSGGLIVYLDLELRPPEGGKGQEGGSAGLIALELPHDGGNAEGGPFPPQPSPNPNPQRQNGVRVVRCRLCNGSRYWHLEGVDNEVCGTCYPPTVGSERVVWIDASDTPPPAKTAGTSVERCISDSGPQNAPEIDPSRSRRSGADRLRSALECAPDGEVA
ncbi:MAG: hypothetical protein JNL28_03600, partial [Planctomycetes bacterium]|nr:hypothetical protein [Planctomycetota bacterium]